MTISMTVILEDGGNCSLTDGIKAIYPRTMVAMDPIRLSSAFSWKKIVKLNNESKKIGIKIVAKALPGYL